MSEGLPSGEAEATIESHQTGTAEAIGSEASPGRRPCNEPDCLGWVSFDAPAATRKCPDHFVGRERRAKEKAPRLVVDLGKNARGKKGDRAADCAKGAEAFLMFGATGLAMAGKGDAANPFTKDAAAVAAGAPAWGAAMGELSKYQPWLADFFAPVGGDSQMKAIFMVFVATAGIGLPIAANHGLLPESLGVMLGGVMVGAEDMAQAAA